MIDRNKVMELYGRLRCPSCGGGYDGGFGGCQRCALKFKWDWDAARELVNYVPDLVYENDQARTEWRNVASVSEQELLRAAERLREIIGIEDEDDETRDVLTLIDWVEDQVNQEYEMRLEVEEKVKALHALRRAESPQGAPRSAGARHRALLREAGLEAVSLAEESSARVAESVDIGRQALRAVRASSRMSAAYKQYARYKRILERNLREDLAKARTLADEAVKCANQAHAEALRLRAGHVPRHERGGIYIASKAKHGAIWRDLRARDNRIQASWIDESEPGQTKDWALLWERCIDEARHAAAVVLYVEPGEQLKGALVEAGAALAAGVPVFVCGIVPPFADRPSAVGTFVRHPGVTVCMTLEEAMRMAGKHYPRRPLNWENEDDDSG